MLTFLIRRLVWGVVVVLATALSAYGMMRVLRPELYGDQGVIAGLGEDVERALLHFDFGEACGFPGCPLVRDMWIDGYAADLWLLAGAFVVGITFGVAGGAWCAARPRSRSARMLEAAAVLAYCTPVYVLGLGLLLLFAPPFGRLQLPFFFEAHSYAPLLDNPWDWVRSLVLPWIVVGAPIAGICLRLTLAMSMDAMHEDYVRTATAKGLPRRQVVRRHAAPTAYVSIASLVGAAVPQVVTNVVLVESVFSVPGFFRNTRRAIGQVAGADTDIPTIQALALWAAVLIVIASLIADLALALLDPRIRAAGRLPG